MPAFRSLLRPFLYIKSVSPNDRVIIETIFLENQIKNYAFILFAILGCNLNNFSFFVLFIALCQKYIWTTYGYIYKKDGCFGYYMCGSSIPEKIGSLEDVENYVKTDWELNVKRMAKYRNL